MFSPMIVVVSLRHYLYMLTFLNLQPSDLLFDALITLVQIPQVLRNLADCTTLHNYPLTAMINSSNPYFSYVHVSNGIFFILPHYSPNIFFFSHLFTLVFTAKENLQPPLL